MALNAGLDLRANLVGDERAEAVAEYRERGVGPLVVLLHRRRAPSRTLVEVRSREELGYLREDLVGDERADGAERVGALPEALPAAGELEGQNFHLPWKEKVLPGVEASGVAPGLRDTKQAELWADDGGAQARGGGAADERLGGVDLYHGGARVFVKGRAPTATGQTRI